MQYKKIIALAGLGCILLAACKKEVTPTLNNPSANLSSYLAQIAPPTQTFMVDAASGATLFLQQGTRVTIPPNAFVNSSGLPQTGNVTVRIKELLKKPDMVLSGVLPISNGEPLKSGGEVYIEAENTSGKLQLASGKSVVFNMPQGGPADNSMIFFAGEPDNKGSFNWFADSTSGYVIANGDTLTLSTDSMRWCNADQFLTNPVYVSFNVTLAGAAAPTNANDILKYAFYDTFNSAWYIAGALNGNSFTADHVANVPIHLVVCFSKDNKFYSGIADFTPVNGGSYTVNVAETTPANFKLALEALP